jgi:hypothetical protein
MGRPRVGSGWKVRRQQFNKLERAAVTAALAAVARQYGRRFVRHGRATGVDLFATGAPRASIYSPRARHGRRFSRHGRATGVDLFATGAPRASIYSPRARHGRIRLKRF